MSDKSETSPNWFKQTSSWLSLLATVISITTFYLTNLRNGVLEIQLPEEVGVRLNTDLSIDLLIPTVFYNTGATNNQRIITGITGTVVLSDSQTFNFRWQDTWDFMGRLDFETRYPEEIAKTPVGDYIIYNGRSVPFVIPGRHSDYKMLRLVPLEAITLGNDMPIFQLTLVVKTTNKNFETAGSYSSKKQLVSEQYMWFHKSEK